MKQNMKRLTIIATIITLALVSFAQSQPTIGYQAVVRTSDGNLICNRQITMRVWILAGNADGNAVYVENHYAATDKNGLFSIEIGRGETSDNWSAIDWSHGPYFVKTEIDPHGGINYSIVSVNQMLSVPYAMYADMAGNMPDVSGYISEETDPTVSAWAKTDSKPAYDYSEITNTPEIPTLPANVSAFANDARYITLSDVPAQVNSNWNATSGTSQILNKPTRVSQFTNDVGYLTSVTETQTIADAAALGNSINAQLKNLANPTDAQDAITKSYLDSITALLDSVFEAQSIALDEIPLIVNSSNAEPSGVQGVCPAGWHLPGDREWSTLTSSTCGYYNAAAILSGNKNLWGSVTLTESEYFGTSGFNILPAGCYWTFYMDFGSSNRLWSSTEDTATGAYNVNVSSNATNISNEITMKYCGFSVRCIKD